MKDNLNLLVVGSGGREHAIAKKLLESSHVEHVYVAPGNIGMESEGISTVAIEETDFDALKGFVYDHGIEWTFVGPEDALCAGIVDSFRKDGLKILDPTKKQHVLKVQKILLWNLWKSIMFLPQNTVRSVHQKMRSAVWKI